MLVYLKPKKPEPIEYYKCEGECRHIWTAIDASRRHFVCPECSRKLIGVTGAALRAAAAVVAADIRRQLKAM